MNEGSQPQPRNNYGAPIRGGGGNRYRGPAPQTGERVQNGAPNNGGYNNNNNLHYEVTALREEMGQLRSSVDNLELEKESLRKAIRKLKLENEHMRKKYKRIQEKIGAGDDVDSSDAEIEQDFDELGRDFLLVGGMHDPLSLRFEVTIRDNDGVEHKSAERYYWYKMAEHFKDDTAKDLIHKAISVSEAEKAMSEIKGFKEAEWNPIRAKHWEDGQRMKLAGYRWILNLLILSDKIYLAVATQDKYFGTGWRKNRAESNKPIYWDGENHGGKILMRLRRELRAGHEWAEGEQDTTRRKFTELRRFVWRRVDPAKRFAPGYNFRGGLRRGGGGGRPFTASTGAPPTGTTNA
uniref:NADAR domain-containing protein n=1 Tax=Panagrellus redivivus TaxID=6233 RepID=A0A7E4ZY28_PANRE